MQSSYQVQSVSSAPEAWQSVGSLVGSVLANVAVGKCEEFDRSNTAGEQNKALPDKRLNG